MAESRQVEMPSKSPKPPKVVGTATPQVDPMSLVEAGVHELPVVKTVLSMMSRASERAYMRRSAAWAAWIVGGKDSATDVVKLLEAALEGSDSDVVRVAVLESARAALDAVDEMVVPAIALLTRRYLQAGTPSIRVFRDVVAFLRLLQADEFAALRSVVRGLDEASRLLEIAGEVRTQCSDEHGWLVVTPAHVMHGDKRLYVSGATTTYRLLEGKIAMRVASALVGRQTSLLADVPVELSVSFDAAMIELLLSIMPPE